MKDKKYRPDRILDYFRLERRCLAAVTVSGLIYNFGLLVGPWFEGKMAECLMKILTGGAVFSDMLRLSLGYIAAIAIVQSARYIKRFYVRRFANNVNRRMKQTLYRTIVKMSRAELEEEGAGNVMTKAISDADDCAEGMRKFTTEIFDTGVALLGYIGMLLYYDWKLTLLCMVFPPAAYVIAEKMKDVVQKNGAAYKNRTGELNAATLDRAENAVTYRVFGCEADRAAAYEKRLAEYEHAAVGANIWNAVLPPLYKVISLAGAAFILYFGAKNVFGIGGTNWTIAIFTTFLSCYTKLAEKSSKAAKLFNSVHKAQVSWKRIFPYMERAAKETQPEVHGECRIKQDSPSLTVRDLSFSYPRGETIFEHISFHAEAGEIIGVTGPVACGKSTFGKTFLCEYPYQGHIFYAAGKSCHTKKTPCGSQERIAVHHEMELSEMSEKERSSLIGYLGHDPELLGDSIKNNILMGDAGDIWEWLSMVRLNSEVMEMEEKEHTVIGTGGVRLSGGQAARTALARTLCHGKPIMILDDPFSALDKKTEAEIFENLRKIGKNKIILLISHRLHLFPKMDQVIWIGEKRAVCGTHDTLLAEIPLYADLYHAQEGGGEDEK